MKWIAVVRGDLKLPSGKLAAQVGHAVMDTLLKTDQKKIAKWQKTGAKKVVVEVASLEQLKEIEHNAKQKKLAVVRITDAGRTVVPAGTITCIGIGPDEEEKLDTVTGNLKML